MLGIIGQGIRLCDGITGRELLRVGGLAIGGLTLSDVLRAQDAVGFGKRKRNKSVIMVWLRGGPSHIDSYDMKRDAPPEIRGEFRPMATSVPGIQLCDLMPQQAQMMDRLAISRGDGRDHWPEAGAAVLAGGGFKTGQIIGETDPHGGRHKGKPYTPANVLATLYRHLGIDPATTIPDYSKRPMHLLDDRELVRELL